MTYSQNIEAFLSKYFLESDKELARLELTLIVVKAQRETLIEMRPPSAS